MKKNTSVYVGEFNRCRGDNIRRCASRLERGGVPASPIPHLTALRIERPAGMDWPTFARTIRGELSPRIGSVVLHSQTTGNTFLCRNKGNRPGRFEKV